MRLRLTVHTVLEKVWCRTVCRTRENFIKGREARTNVTPINIILPQDARQLRVGHEGRGIA